MTIRVSFIALRVRRQGKLMNKNEVRKEPHKPRGTIRDLDTHKDPKGGPTGRNWDKVSDAGNRIERNFSPNPR